MCLFLFSVKLFKHICRHTYLHNNVFLSIDYRDILDSIAPDVFDVSMESLLPFLQSHHLVTQNEQQHLSSTTYIPNDRSQKLLSYMKCKGDESLQKFLCCLNLAHEHTGHKGIADKLKQNLKANGIDCNDFCSDECKKRLQVHT